MANKEKGNFNVTTNSGKKVSVQQIKCNGERWYETADSGRTTIQITNAHNKKILNSLIPEKTEPVYGNSFINPKDIIFHKALKENEKKI